jgi:hypothetical protein
MRGALEYMFNKQLKKYLGTIFTLFFPMFLTIVRITLESIFIILRNAYVYFAVLRSTQLFPKA